MTASSGVAQGAGSVSPAGQAERSPFARTTELLAEQPMPQLSELRRRFPAHIDDEELVLRVVMPQDQVDAMKTTPKSRCSYNPKSKPILALLKEIGRRSDLSYFSLQKPGFKIVLTR